ncbi:HD-GYP domain-containing protein [Oleidesulfovibrio sp.]|uniref:HD-GYP domain-containing protein n=1 Tax=Oleidesulfovibrio sp. TaxID=2909707 RepID=UPI003A83B6F1
MKVRRTAMVKTLIRHPEILLLLLVAIISTVALPLRSYFVVLPHFSEKLLDYSEEEAEKTAHFWASKVIRLSPSQPITLHEDIDALMKSAIVEFGLEKVKIFDADGKIVYSTAPADIGKINRHDYFTLIVAEGKKFSKIVTKNQQTLEGRVVTKDVAEIYIPLKNNNKFAGAFELYYDLTARKEELDRLLIKEAVIGAAISLFLFGLVLMVIIHACKVNYYRYLAEEQIKLLNRDLEKIVDAQTRELKVTQEVSIQSLAILAESYDPDTGEHLNRIRNLTSTIAERLKSEGPYASYLAGKDNYIDELALASILHDIGKTSIPVEILSKPDKLTKEEFEIVKGHTSIAGLVLRLGNETFLKEFGKDSYLALAADIALYHHERWDGTGYPHGLKGEEIPLSARIVALADVYALCSERPYKEPWSHERAVDLIKSEAGKHFDPVVVAAFLDIEQSIKKDFQSYLSG